MLSKLKSGFATDIGLKDEWLSENGRSIELLRLEIGDWRELSEMGENKGEDVFGLTGFDRMNLSKEVFESQINQSQAAQLNWFGWLFSALLCKRSRDS